MLFAGLGDSAKENGLEEGVAAPRLRPGTTVGVLAGNEKAGFTGEGVAGVAGVVETEAEAAGVGVANENGANGAFASGAGSLTGLGVLAG